MSTCQLTPHWTQGSGDHELYLPLTSSSDSDTRVTPLQIAICRALRSDGDSSYPIAKFTTVQLLRLSRGELEMKKSGTFHSHVFNNVGPEPACLCPSHGAAQ